ncbi:MAG TPA: kelch repeat-containing protein [Stellaceae bacterium]|nr:kelch repeat-containing protein [Stellaceae bacterium]
MKQPRLHLVLSALMAACAVAAAPQAWAQPQWKFAEPLPRTIGEIYGTTIAGKVYVLGGLDNRPGVSAPTGYNWEYDPLTNKWTARKAMPRPAHHIMIAPWQNKIYVFGGFVRPKTQAAWQPVSNAWVYDPASDAWKALAPMPTPRGAGQAVALGGKIYVIGGAHSNKPGDPGAPIGLGSPAQIVVGTVEAYDPATNTWQTRAPMPTPRNHFLAAAVGGKIYALDGRIGSCFVTKSAGIDIVEAYDPAANQWAFAGRDLVPRGDVVGAAHDGRIYVAGGEGQDFARKYTFWLVDAFNPATHGWTRLPHMQVARHGFAAAFVGNRLHVVGGAFQSDGMPRVETATNTHEVLDLGE